MTTLPQTTPIRIPRPAPLAIPAAAPLTAPLLPNVAHPQPGLTGADVIRVLRHNVWLLILMLILGGVGGCVLNTWLAAKHARYTATGYIRVMTESDLPRPGQVFPADGGSNGVDLELHDQAARLKHPSLINHVLAESQKLRDTHWFSQFVHKNNGKPEFDLEEAKTELLDHLTVAPVPQSRLLAVSFSCGVPADSQTIVQEVIEQHIKEQRQLHQDTESDESRRLQRLKLQYEQDLQETQSRIGGIMRELSEGGQPVNGSGTHDIELTTLTTAQVHAQENLIESEQRLQRLLKELKETGTSTEVEDSVAQNPRYVQSQAQIDQASAAQESLKASMGEANAVVVRNAESLDRLKKMHAALHEDLKTYAIERLRNLLTQSVSSSRANLESINGKIRDVQAKLAEMAGRRNDFERLRFEEQSSIARLNSLKEMQLNFDNWDVDGHFAHVQWATQPDLPGTPTFPKLPLTLALSIILSLGLGLAIAFLREVTDTSVRSPSDIARIGHLHLLGIVPHQDDDPQAVTSNLPLLIYEAPYSMIAEQFRQVRTRLQHSASLDTTRSILVTGCAAGDGKTTIASNLAAGLALNGRRILLVDANFRRPQLHRIFELENRVGFGDVLNAPETLEEAVQATPVPNLSVLVVGTRPSNPTELLESQLLIDFIETALRDYDHVVFDSGPLLLVSETVGLAPRVDGVITVVRASGNNRGTLQRLRDQLRILKAEHLGVILNAVRVHGGGYYGPMIKSYYAYGDADDELTAVASNRS